MELCDNNRMTIYYRKSYSVLIIRLVYRLSNRGCKLVGCGSALPSLQISNDDLAKMVDTNDEWISVRTGIRNRRVLSGEFLLLLNNCV